MMTLRPFRSPYKPEDPRTLLARDKHAAGRLKTHDLVAAIQEKERLNRVAARELVEARLPDYEDLPMVARS